MSFPRYPKYKDSSVDWLGDVPEHWDVVPLKHLASLKGRLGWQGLRSDEYTEEGPFLVTSEHFANDRIEWHRCYHVPYDRYAMAPEIQLRPDDLLMMKDGAAMGKLAYVEHLPGPACLNSHLLLFRPINGRFANRFLYYVLGGPSFKAYMVQERTGTTFFGISQESIGAFPFVVPPIGDQERILGFLDRETVKIDGLVAEQRRLIELLREKRQAVISHAVTKGLNPAAPMKPSGIEWLGDVPAHWVVAKLGHYASVENGSTPSRNDPDFWTDGDIPWLSSGEVNQYVITEAVEYITRAALDASSLRLIPTEAVIVGMIGQGKTRGTSAMLGIEATINQNMAAVIPKQKLATQYLHFIFQSAYEQLRECGRGGQQAALNCEILSAFLIPLPPLQEQREISDCLKERLGKLDALTAEAERAIELLQERRTALISAAVTGKIDVRGEV